MRALSQRRVLVLEAALGATLAFAWLGGKSLWFDEITTLIFTRSWASLRHYVPRIEPNMSLYYVLLHFWVKLGEHEIVVRGLSALFGAACVPLTHAVAARLFGSRAGWLAALLLATNAFFLKYVQQARGYSLVLLLTLGAAYGLLLLLDGVRSWRVWCGTVLAAVLAPFAHLYAVLVLIAFGLAVLVARPRDALRVPVLWAGAVIGGALIGTLLLFMNADTGQVSWLAPPRVRDVAETFRLLAGGGRLLWLYALLGGVALCGAARKGAGRQGAWPLVFVPAWFLFPIGAAFVYSVLVSPAVTARYLLVCVPPFAMLAGAGLARIRPRMLRVAVLLLALGMGGREVLRHYRGPSKEQWREATQYVLSDARPGDAMLCYLYVGQEAVEYYMRRLRAEPGLIEMVPFAAGPELCGAHPDKPDFQKVAALYRHYERVWLVLSHHTLAQMGRPPIAAALRQSLAARYALSADRTFRGVHVLRYERRPAPEN